MTEAQKWVAWEREERASELAAREAVTGVKEDEDPVILMQTFGSEIEAVALREDIPMEQREPFIVAAVLMAKGVQEILALRARNKILNLMLQRGYAQSRLGVAT